MKKSKSPYRTRTHGIGLAGIVIGMGRLFPIMFNMIGMTGSVFLPMHIPVMLAGIVCGAFYGMTAGIVVPFISSFISGTPAIYPVAVYMAFELAAYGILCGLLSRRLGIILTLAISMIGGRLVLAVAQLILLGAAGRQFTLEGFITASFITAVPGIILQFVAVPVIVRALRKNRMIQ